MHQPSKDRINTIIHQPNPVSNVLPLVYTSDDPQPTMRLLAFSGLQPSTPETGRPGLLRFELASTIVGLSSLTAGAVFRLRGCHVS
jgi:hypothetical protein